MNFSNVFSIEHKKIINGEKLNIYIVEVASGGHLVIAAAAISI